MVNWNKTVSAATIEGVTTFRNSTKPRFSVTFDTGLRGFIGSDKIDSILLK